MRNNLVAQSGCKADDALFLSHSLSPSLSLAFFVPLRLGLPLSRQHASGARTRTKKTMFFVLVWRTRRGSRDRSALQNGAQASEHW